MSAPTPAPGDDRPREGYYPDPSIPGYVRYWNGASWVAGTSRPAPKDGEPLAPPPGVRPAAPAVASVEETGPHFFDEDPVEEPSAGASQHGSRPEPASAWGADHTGQPGSARVAWPNAQGADPRVPHARTGPGGGAGASASGEIPGQAPAGPAPQGPAGPTGAAPAHAASPTDRPASGSAAVGPAGAGPAYGDPAAAQSADAGPAATGAAGAGQAYGDPASARSAAPASGASGSAGAGQGYADPAAAQVAGDGSADGRAGRPGVSSGDAGNPAGGAPADAEGGAGSTFVFRRPTAGPQAAPAADEGTITFRAVPPRAAPGTPDASAPPGTGGPGFAAGKAAAVQGTAGPQQGPAAAPPALSGPQQAGGPAGSAVPRQAAAPQPQPVQSPPQPAASAPVAVGPGGGQSSWAQQVHRLAGAGGDDQPVVPWKPPVDDVFQAAARRQAAARPAGVGKRLAARLIDTVVLAGVTAVAAVPLGAKAIDHVNDKIDAAKLSGETVTVWLLDGTTATYLGIVLAVLLLFGVVYEALPTAKWGRTLGKKLLGLEVRDIEAHEPPSFGAALRRWLVYSVPGLLAVGVVGVAWCLFDRPWHQCWHDKAAGTFVAA
ncbi:RDD family protein [Streptomyces flaveolus]|uniref:RDD family protein n=1 Tax=Streptomyces flaveolus TaxID=67297 RepID=A0ABV1VD58_9ACTN